MGETWAGPPLLCPACRRPPEAWPLDGDLRCSSHECVAEHSWLTPGIPVVVGAGLGERIAASDACGPLPAQGELGAWLKQFKPGHAGFGQLSRAAIYLRAMRRDREEPFYSELCDALLGDLRFERVLDLGCGAGNLAVALARRGGAGVTALDLDAHLLRWAERALSMEEFDAPARVSAGRFVAERMSIRPAGPVNLLCGNLLDPPFEAGSFDLVALVNVVDAVPYPAVALGQAIALMAPGGHLLFASPDSWNVATTSPSRWLATTESGWDRVFAKEGLETVARIDDLEWRLQDTPRLHHLYRVHGRLLRKA